MFSNLHNIRYHGNMGGRTQITLTHLNWTMSKTPVWSWFGAESCRYLTYKLRYSRFCVQMATCQGNKGGFNRNLNDSVWLADHQNLSLVQKCGNYLYYELSCGGWVVFYVPANTYGTVFTGQKTKPTVGLSKYWRKKLQRKNQKTQTTKYTYTYTPIHIKRIYT